MIFLSVLIKIPMFPFEIYCNIIAFLPIDKILECRLLNKKFDNEIPKQVKNIFYDKIFMVKNADDLLKYKKFIKRYNICKIEICLYSEPKNKHIENLDHVRELYIEGCFEITSKAFKKMKHLKQIDITGCYNLLNHKFPKGVIVKNGVTKYSNGYLLYSKYIRKYHDPNQGRLTLQEIEYKFRRHMGFEIDPNRPKIYKNRRNGMLVEKPNWIKTKEPDEVFCKMQRIAAHYRKACQKRKDL